LSKSIGLQLVIASPLRASRSRFPLLFSCKIDGDLPRFRPIPKT
jgi:hypothetical protein